VVAQHIADGFIPGLVSWLDATSKIKILAAEAGQKLKPGHAYVAPTGRNMVVVGDHVEFVDPLKSQLYIPSADTLFDSVARSHGKRSVGVILTGMGADGAMGLKRMHDVGAATIAQDEETCTVYGMPKAAVELGAADKVLPLPAIGRAIVDLLGAKPVS
jgi:two-component system chemotaxis response regulator CheB